jgi:uncharacterized protein (DUF305 family)
MGWGLLSWVLVAAGRILSLVIVALVTATLVGSCGARSGQDAQAGKHNSDDVNFAEMMIPHHQQALEMGAMVPTRTANRDLLVLAQHIAMDQQAEIETLKGLLTQWGERVPADNAGHVMTMTGMVDQATMNQLPLLRGDTFYTLWIKSMIVHHQGAVDMARTEIAHGVNPDALRIANIILTSQQREISYMHHLLNVPQ